jgi:hypothetical protein
MVTSSTKRIVSNTNRKGHIYRVEGIEADRLYLNNNGDRKITVTFTDLTTSEKITRRGVAKMAGNGSALWIDSFEGHKKLFFADVSVGEMCKVVKVKNSYNGKTSHWLAEQYYWNK